MPNAIPVPDPQVSLRALQAMIRARSPLAALEVFRAGVGDIYQANLPNFKPIIMAGPAARKFVYSEHADDLRWRAEGDPVTRLLRDGVLVTDGEQHDRLRMAMQGTLMHKVMIEGYIDLMARVTDQLLDTWADGATLDMLVEMRKVALMIITQTLYGHDFRDELAPLWQAVLRTIQYISPGLWMLWRDVPRPGYARALAAMDAYLYRLIALRRAAANTTNDLLGVLIAADMSDDLIRDQLLTMFIAGHDTSTALLAWVLYLLGAHPEAMAQAQAEADTINTPQQAHTLKFIEMVNQEALRLYPPIHLSARHAAHDLEFNGYHIAAGQRVLFSIYLTQRHPDLWQQAAVFRPQRFAEIPRAQLTPIYMPFGGGARNCIGVVFAQVEARIVLARILQRFTLTLVNPHVHAHMGATLEPRPGVWMAVRKRHVSRRRAIEQAVAKRHVS
jgi:cytochrome P450